MVPVSKTNVSDPEPSDSLSRASTPAPLIAGPTSSYSVSALGTSYDIGTGGPSNVVPSEAEKQSMVAIAATTAVGQGDVIFVPKLAQCSASTSLQSGVGFVKTFAKAINYYSGGTITGRFGATGVGGFLPGIMPPATNSNPTFNPGGTTTTSVGSVAGGTGSIMPPATSIFSSGGRGRRIPALPPGTTINPTFAPGGTTTTIASGGIGRTTPVVPLGTIIASGGTGRTTPVLPPGTTMNPTFAPGGTTTTSAGSVAGGTSSIMPPATNIIALGGIGPTTPVLPPGTTIDPTFAPGGTTTTATIVGGNSVSLPMAKSKSNKNVTGAPS